MPNNLNFNANNRTLLDKPLPNENVPPEKKLEKGWGLKVAEAIYARNRFGYFTYDSDKQRIKENRRYGEGLQTINKYKPNQDVQGDRSIDNLDYTADSITAKYVDVVIGDMIDRDYEMLCKAVDAFSYTEKDKIRRRLLSNMMLKDFDNDIRKLAGIPVIPDSDFTPQDKDELELYMQMNVKLAWEIAMEKIINHVFEINNWEEIQRRLVRDLVENKFGAARVYYDEDYNIRLRYADIDNLVYPRTDYPDFRNVKYQAEFRQMTLGEIRDLAGNDLTEQDIFNIGRDFAGKQESYYWGWGTTYYSRRYHNGDYEYDNYQVDVLDFVLYTTDSHHFKERKSNNGNEFFDKYNPSKYKPKKGEKTQKKSMQVAYQGYWVTGSKYLFSWKRLRNQTREKRNGKYLPYVLPEFIMYAPNLRDMTNKSLVERIRPHADAINLYRLRLQHIVSKIPPPGVSVDVNAINDIVLGGKTLKAEQIIEMWFRDGSVFYDSMDDSGERRNYKPVELNQVQIPQLVEVINLIQYEINQIENVTGINSARDASSPDSKTLVGAQQIAYQGSLNATKEIYEAAIEIQKNIAKKIMRMIQNKIEYGHGIEEFKNIINTHDIEVLEITKGLTNAEMGISIEPILDEEDKATLNQNIALSLQAQEISISDAETARGMKNKKLAAQFLDQRRRKNAKERAELAAQESQAKAQADQQTVQIASELKQNEIELELNKDLALQENKAELDEARAASDHERKMDEIRLSKGFDIQKTRVNNETKEVPLKQE